MNKSLFATTARDADDRTHRSPRFPVVDDDLARANPKRTGEARLDSWTVKRAAGMRQAIASHIQMSTGGRVGWSSPPGTSKALPDESVPIV
jgi:hypothetical protein